MSRRRTPRFDRLILGPSFWFILSWPTGIRLIPCRRMLAEIVTGCRMRVNLQTARNPVVRLALPQERGNVELFCNSAALWALRYQNLNPGLYVCRKSYPVDWHGRLLVGVVHLRESVIMHARPLPLLRMLH